jgi:Putative transposase
MAVKSHARGVASSPMGEVLVDAHDRKRLKQLCRHITRPALSDERVQLNDTGQVELKLETPWQDGTMHLVLSPVAFMHRQAAPVPTTLTRSRGARVSDWFEATSSGQ